MNSILQAATIDYETFYRVHKNLINEVATLTDKFRVPTWVHSRIIEFCISSIVVRLLDNEGEEHGDITLFVDSKFKITHIQLNFTNQIDKQEG